jgi:hypothetical protein
LVLVENGNHLTVSSIAKWSSLAGAQVNIHTR